MADSELGAPPALGTLYAAWRAAFDRVTEELAASTRAFDETLADADSEEAHAGALAELAGVRARAELSIAALSDLTRRVEVLHAEWRAARRYDPEVLERLLGELGEKVAAHAETGAQDWLSELFDALESLEWDAVARLTGGISWPPELQDGAQELAAGLERWGRGEHAVGLELMERLGDAELDGWSSVLDDRLSSRALRLAAWIALRRLRKPDLAERHLSAALTLWPHAGRMHAERAAYYLSIGDLDRAATDAQRSVELAQDDAAGYLELGIWAELSGDFDDADQFYRKSLALLPTIDVARLGTRVSLMDPPGRLLTRAAERMLDVHRPRDALHLAEQALHADQRGPELHPQSAAHHARFRALQQLRDRPAREAAEAALEAGRLYAWNGAVGTAVELFERAEALDDSLEEVGWLLADARLTTSLPRGATMTDQRVVTQALETWERWARKVGPPRDDTSWAYLTRAMIADLGTQHPGANRLEGIWVALLNVEKALLHDDVDPPRWGYVAQYLRYLHLDDLALEATDRGYKLGSGDRQVLAERLAQLAYRGRLAEADEVAEELVTMFGNDPWVSAARAWLAIHSDRPSRYADGLGLLELPLAGGNDPSWYYEMRALCHVGLKRVDAARSDFRGMLRHALPVDGTTKSRLEIAAVALRDATQAGRWSSEAARDPTSRPITLRTADAFAAFARGEPDAAVALLTEATEHATSIVELHDVCDMTRLRLPLLAADDDVLAGWERAVDRVADGAVVEREQALAGMEPDADRELDVALATLAGDDASTPLARVALMAAKARRDAHAGRLSEAAAAYQELLGTRFEPEATAGLTRILGRLAGQQAAAGEVQHVKELTERMTALGHVSRAEVATTVASALEQSGRRSQAREQLEAAIATAANDRERTKLHQRAGGLALAEDDLDDAAEHFQAALEIARNSGAHGRTGQVLIRMALIGILRGDPEAAREHLLAAARAWKEGGAVEPAAALLSELHGLRRLRGGRWADAAGGALEMVEQAVDPKGSPAELEPLRRELGIV